MIANLEGKARGGIWYWKSPGFGTIIGYANQTKSNKDKFTLEVKEEGGEKGWGL